MQRLGSLLLKSSEVIQGLRFYSQGIRAIQDLDLLKILQSEINHELTSKPPAQVLLNIPTFFLVSCQLLNYVILFGNLQSSTFGGV